MLLAAPPIAAAGPDAQLEVAIANLRSSKGVVRLCLTRNRAHFPRCQDDPEALRLSAPAAKAGLLTFTAVPAGDYAIAAFHDENGNAKLDTMAKIPREGFGFSRNPPIRFGPPSFTDVLVNVRPGGERQVIRLRYIL
jgi:uncharacterized protein (DUF2141 family)